MDKKILRMFCAVLIFADIAMLVFQLITGTEQKFIFTLVGMLNIISLLFLGIYCLLGGSKKQRIGYVAALVIKVISLLASIIYACMPGYESYWPISWNLANCSILLVAFLILLLAKDLGQKKTNIITCVLLILPIIDVIVGLTSLPQAEIFTSKALYIIAIGLSNFVFAGTIFSATAIKYADKQERYSKKEK